MSAEKDEAIVVLTITRFGGDTLTVAHKARKTGGYELVPDGTGRWLCACEGFARRGTCAHSRAAEQPTPATLPPLARAGRQARREVEWT